MKLADIDEMTRVFALLVGKKLCHAKNAGNMKIFGFGERLGVDAEHTVPAFGLHVHCPWRLEDKGRARIITGFSDFYVPAPDNSDSAWEPTNGKGSLQNFRILELLHEPGSPSTSNSNTTGELVVAEALLLPCYGLQIDFLPCYRLIVFPDGSVDEQWRFLMSGTPSTHYVLANSTLFVE